MPKPDLGVKRVCPETGKKFYDLNKDPIVSPFTGMEYPLSFFEEEVTKAVKKPPTKADVEDDADKKTDDDEETKDDEEEDEDAPQLDEAPIDMGNDDEDDDAGGAPAAAASEDDDDFEGFSDEEANLDDDDDDSLLIDDEDDADLGNDIDLAGGDKEDL